MLLTDELKVGLTPEQIQAIENVYSEKETEFNALANKNADGIFNGAAMKLTELTGVHKLDNEKYSTYFERLASEWLPTKAEQRVLNAEKKAEEKVRELEEKIRTHKGDETLKTELQKAREELNKIPDLLAAKENEWKTKYEDEVRLNTEFKVNTSINNSLPKFDDTINKFELEAKKKAAIDRIKSEYELSFDDKNNLIGTKDYQKFLVADLLKNDAELKDLVMIEHGQGGGGAGDRRSTKALNIPKEISKAASQQIIREYMKTTEGIDILSPKHSERFKELCKENEVL